jgi:hypothetical protein
MILALLAGDSMFAATRFSFGVSVDAPAYAPPAYNTYVAPGYNSGFVYRNDGYGDHDYGYRNYGCRDWGYRDNGYRDHDHRIFDRGHDRNDDR